MPSARIKKLSRDRQGYSARADFPKNSDSARRTYPAAILRGRNIFGIVQKFLEDIVSLLLNLKRFFFSTTGWVSEFRRKSANFGGNEIVELLIASGDGGSLNFRGRYSTYVSSVSIS